LIVSGWQEINGKSCKTFCGIIYATIGITSVKIFRKYAHIGENYADKSFITLTPGITAYFMPLLAKPQ